MPKINHSKPFDRTVFLFQGGGALGSYQVGVFKALSENGYLPDWMIATSIGAINCAIIVGNPAEKRIEKLNGFWNTIATKLPPTPDTINNVIMERWQHFWNALYTKYFGLAEFFKPRWLNPWLSLQSTVDKLSYYDTDELRTTLERFVDFDLINEKKIRLSMGAVRIETGDLVYFDNTKIEIKPEHVMASGALPPGFPAVLIDNDVFWDGGVHSNTQIDLLLSDDEPNRTLCFMVNLFDSYGTTPTTMDEVIKRKDDIGYASHHRQFIKTFQNLHNLRHMIRILSEKLPEETKKDPKVQKLIKHGRASLIHIVRFHYKSRLSDLSSKCYEFSLPSVKFRTQRGYEDVCKVLRNPPWHKPHPEAVGLLVSEVSDHLPEDENPFE